MKHDAKSDFSLILNSHFQRVPSASSRSLPARPPRRPCRERRRRSHPHRSHGAEAHGGRTCSSSTRCCSTRSKSIFAFFFLILLRPCSTSCSHQSTQVRRSPSPGVLGKLTAGQLFLDHRPVLHFLLFFWETFRPKKKDAIAISQKMS